MEKDARNIHFALDLMSDNDSMSNQSHLGDGEQRW